MCKAGRDPRTATHGLRERRPQTQPVLSNGDQRSGHGRDPGGASVFEGDELHHSYGELVQAAAVATAHAEAVLRETTKRKNAKPLTPQAVQTNKGAKHKIKRR